MLKSTFIHIQGVGPKRELAIWRAGVRTWEDFLAKGKEVLPKNVYNLGRPVIERSLQALQDSDGLRWLAKVVPNNEHWRFYPYFGRVVYLDIEAGGDLDEWGGITVVGLYDGQETRQYVSNHNMWLVNDSMKQYNVLITFAGSSYDLPMLRQVFSNITLPPVHIDLRWVLRKLGLTGGLKRIEKRLGIERPPEVHGMDGQGAVLLWAEHLAGDPQALETLLAYNACDIVNLEPLLEYAVQEMKRRLFYRASL